MKQAGQSGHTPRKGLGGRANTLGKESMSSESHLDLWALGDLCTPWCFHVVVTLGVPERVEAGAHAVEVLADNVGCNADYLQQVLRHLVGKGVFHEPTTGFFELAPAARPMLDPTFRLGLDLDGLGGR